MIDHDECDGQWQGTLTYTEIRTYKGRTEKPSSDTGFQKTESSYVISDNTLTLSGTITANSKFGHDSPANSSVDEISILDEYSTKKLVRGNGTSAVFLAADSNQLRFGQHKINDYGLYQP